MKKYFAGSLITGSEITDFFIMRSLAVRVGTNQRQYIDMTLGDKSGEVSAKKWNATEEDINEIKSYGENPIIKIRGSVTEWNGKQQLKVTRFRIAREDDNLDMNDFVKTAPFPGKEMYDEIMSYVDEITDDELKTIARAVMERNHEKLLYYPAASKNHHAQMSGLLYHMKRMLLMGVKACEVYTELDKDWVITGVIIHDIEKINEIISNKWGVSPGYSMEGQLLGHIVQGVCMIDKLAEEFGTSREKAVMLEHMILSHHYEPEFGSPKRPMFAEAELLHHLDNLDAKLFDFEEKLEVVPPGEFTDRIWTLDNRKLYKPTFKKPTEDPSYDEDEPKFKGPFTIK